MNVEIGAEAAQLPEKEYINVIAVAVQTPHSWEVQKDLSSTALQMSLGESFGFLFFWI
jgi:hypothetical protein